jgi:A predicted alpha-helical domain with a conserved ER motif.
MVGGLGYVLAPGNTAYKLNTIAAKDVWVQPPTRVQAEVTAPLIEPPMAPLSRTRGIRSPRVLSDLFWLGRYGERAESTARLLTVTRDRYHEYRYRQHTVGSECVPVLLAALGQLTGIDTGDSDLFAAASKTLWALTVDQSGPDRCRRCVASSRDGPYWTSQRRHHFGFG